MQFGFAFGLCCNGCCIVASWVWVWYVIVVLEICGLLLGAGWVC